MPFVPERGDTVDLLAPQISLTPAPPLAQTEQVTIAAVRTPEEQAEGKSAAAVISLLQEIADSGQKLPKRELNELTRAVDRLWGRLQDKG